MTDTDELAPGRSDTGLQSPAIFSGCGRYRYWLRRIVDTSRPGHRSCVWIMLNPSTADATENDPTTRRCMAFARRWGYTDHVAVNLFALRSPYPKDLWADGVSDPVGPDNDTYLDDACEVANGSDGIIICAWGNDGSYMDRGKEVLGRIQHHRLHVVGMNQTGEPRFPLYLPNSTTPTRWEHHRD